MSRRAIQVLTLLAILAPTAAVADDASVQSRRLDRRSSVYVDGGVILSVPAESGRLGAGSFGISVGRVLSRRFGAEVSLGRLINDSSGAQCSAALRLSQPFGFEERWAANVAAGPALTFGESFGRTLLGRGELGIAFQAASGVVAGYAIVVESALVGTDEGSNVAQPLERGDTGVGWRLTLGYAF